MARLPAPRLWSGLLLVIAALLLYVSLPNLGHVIRAARADGEPGVFTAQHVECVQHPGHESCTWSGTFRSRGGGEAVQTTYYGAGRDSMRPGEKRRAVDVGFPGRVYSPDGSREWIFTVALLLAGFGLLGYLGRKHLMPPPLRETAGAATSPSPAAERLTTRDEV